MSAVPSESTNKLLETVSFCRASIATTLKLGLGSAAVVALLSLTAGALPSTSVIRGGICFLVFGLIGWGINAVLVAAGEKPEKLDDTYQEDLSSRTLGEDGRS